MTSKDALGNVSSWQKALQDASVAISDVQQAHEFASTKTLLPQFHDKNSDYYAGRLNSTINLTNITLLCLHCVNIVNPI